MTKLSAEEREERIVAANERRRVRAYVKGLRELARFIERKPELCPECGETVFRFAHDKETMQRLAPQLGTCRKRSQGGWYNLERSFGPHNFQLTIEHRNYCERRQVGIKKLQVPDPEELKSVPLVTVEEPIYEWDCPDSVLAPAEPDREVAANTPVSETDLF